MSKKILIIISVVLVIIIGLLLLAYQSGFLFKKTTDYNANKNGSSSIPASAEEADESSKTGTMSDEACIEIYAYTLRIAETDDMAKAKEYGSQIEKLNKKYGTAMVESDAFDEYCDDRFLNDSVYARLKTRLRELGSDIE